MKKGKWTRKDQDKHRQRNPRLTDEDRRAQAKAAENYAKAQGQAARVLEATR